MMNRSAKDGARSSRHYDGEGVLTHPSHQGVCERHGTEELDVTPGGLDVFPGGAGITDPIRPLSSNGTENRVKPCRVDGWRHSMGCPIGVIDLGA